MIDELKHAKTYSCKWQIDMDKTLQRYLFVTGRSYRVQKLKIKMTLVD